MRLGAEQMSRGTRANVAQVCGMTDHRLELRDEGIRSEQHVAAAKAE